MMRRGWVPIPALLLALTLAPSYGQSSAGSAKPASGAAAAAHSGNAPAESASAATTPQAASTGAAAGNAKSDCLTGPCDYQPPKITVANPPAIIVPWLVRDQITWAANLVLVLLGYVGILLGVSLLRKIERQTRAAEEAAEAARSSADAALLQAQALQRAERPWLTVAVEPATGRENSFAVVAVNRGKSVARIETVQDEVVIAADEEHLPARPQYRGEGSQRRRAPVILLPGESLELKRFGRDDVQELCGAEDRLKRVEDWEEKIYLYGRIVYTDLTAAEGEPAHETGWCCWYIHGRQKSGMIMAGPPDYNRHT